MAFEGYLMKFGNDLFPMEVIQYDTYKIVPNIRQDKNSKRVATGVLARNVIPNRPSTIKFSTIDGLSNTVVERMMNFVRKHYKSEAEKRVSITHYCPDTNSYKTSDFYLDPSQEFPIKEIDTDKKTIVYNAINFEFIGY